MDLNPVILAQIGGGESWWSWIAWIFFLMIFFMFYPRLMTSQIMWKLERSAKELERMSDVSKKFIIKEVGPPTKTLRENIDRFFEFFLITPVSLDPFGIVGKLEHIIQDQKGRFDEFANEVLPGADAEKKACIKMGLAGGITLHEIAKIVRHYVEMVRKTKSIQIAMLLQMQLPLIERFAKAVFKGTKTMAKGKPIGDSIGPLVIATMMGIKPTAKEIEEEILASKTKMNGRTVYMIKAKGPGGRLGRPGKAVEKIVNHEKIVRIITVDAAAKLEGEKTGSIAEGVGVAMGGPGVERSFIENIAVKKKIPLDSIAIKMSQEEAIMPMRKVLVDSLPKVNESIVRSLKRTGPDSKVILVGVGNTSGVGNSAKDAKDTISWVEKYEKRLKLEKKKDKES